MYLAVDIGGTKTLVASFDGSGKKLSESQFPTNSNYSDFIAELEENVKGLKVQNFSAGCVGCPGRLDRENGIGLAFGNLDWRNVPIQPDVERIINAPVVIENDAKLAGLYEARQIINDFNKVLYVTISTGIGTGVIIDGAIDKELQDFEGGSVLLEYQGKSQKWESFASGKAIVSRYGMKAEKISDPKIWQQIAHVLSGGFLNMIATIQPEVIVIGGGVGQYFNRFEKYLLSELRAYETPLVPIPPIKVAKRPTEAVIYGCFELAKDRYGSR